MAIKTALYWTLLDALLLKDQYSPDYGEVLGHRHMFSGFISISDKYRR